jgi:hypothetical protein
VQAAEPLLFWDCETMTMHHKPREKDDEECRNKTESGSKNVRVGVQEVQLVGECILNGVCAQDLDDALNSEEQAKPVVVDEERHDEEEDCTHPLQSVTHITKTKSIYCNEVQNHETRMKRTLKKR